MYIRHSAESDPNAVTIDEIVSQAALSYWVATSANGGSDSNPGTQALPFLTIQKAIDVLPKRIKHAVQINVGAGTFAGAMLEGFVFETLGTDATGLYITGTLGTSTLASGLTTGTFASATAGTANTTTWGTATATSAGWTVDDLRGRFVRIDSGTGAGQVRAIDSNTADTITVAGSWTAPTGATFTIVEPSTILNAASNAQIGTPSVHVQGCTGGAFAAFVPDRMAVHLVNLRFTGGRGLMFQSAGLRAEITNLAFDNTTEAVILAGEVGGRVEVNDCAFRAAATTQFQAQDGAGALVQRCVFVGGASGFINTTSSLAKNSAGTTTDVRMSRFRAQTTIAVNGGAGSTNVQGCKIDAVTPGSRVGVRCSPPGQMRIINSDISNCGTAVSMLEPLTYIECSGLTGTGNTTAISVAKGAALQVNSGSTITGTTELSVDGTATTLAVMRAQSPKILTDPNYGSKVFE